MLQPFVPPKDLEEAIARLEVAEEKAAEAEFLQLALKEKSNDRIVELVLKDLVLLLKRYCGSLLCSQSALN
jgi:hypothetical protein